MAVDAHQASVKAEQRNRLLALSYRLQRDSLQARGWGCLSAGIVTLAIGLKTAVRSPARGVVAASAFAACAASSLAYRHYDKRVTLNQRAWANRVYLRDLHKLTTGQLKLVVLGNTTPEESDEVLRWTTKQSTELASREADLEATLPALNDSAVRAAQSRIDSGTDDDDHDRDYK